MPLQKRALSKLLMIIVTLGVFVTPFLFSTMPMGKVAAATAQHITLTWAADPQTTQTITWTTEVTKVGGQVEYSEEVNSAYFPHDAKSQRASVEDVFTNLGNISIHSVTLTGLKPGTSYRYRVGDEIDWSASRSFNTAAVQIPKFKFLVFGDSQSYNYNVWRSTLHQAYQGNPEAVFFTNMGDLVDIGQDYAQWQAWLSAAQGVVDTIPVMPVAGNHESYTPERKFSMPLLFTAQLKLPLNGPEGLEGQVYSFDYGNVHFSMLDSQEGEERGFRPNMLALQKAWLENDLRTTNKKWKIIGIHRSPYSNKQQGDNDNIRVAFEPIIDKYHVDVVFTGHDHVYAHTYPLYNGEVVAPSEGTIYVATGRSGTKTYRDNKAHDLNDFFYNPLDEPNYITVEVDIDRLIVKAFKQSGTRIDEWTIDKTMVVSK